mgnify:CR=1 FL=1
MRKDADGKESGKKETTDEYGVLQGCLAAVRKKTAFSPKVALVLGSGLGDFADRLTVEEELSYREIEGFPVSTVQGHEGRLIFGYLGTLPIVCMKGRVHYYEGYTPEEVVRPIRLLWLLGARVLFLTNAAGGLLAGMAAGDLMLLTDQLSFFVPNPLVGENIEALGTRFPDMSYIYAPALQGIIRGSAAELGIPLHEGIYAQLSGPSYETPAEIRALKAMGVGAVGMSTAMEAIAARHAGMEVCGISCISNLAAGLSDFALDHSEVQEAGRRAAEKFAALVEKSISRFAEVL